MGKFRFIYRESNAIKENCMILDVSKISGKNREEKFVIKRENIGKFRDIEKRLNSKF